MIVLHIARRQLGSFFMSPVGYIALAVFYVLFGVVFCSSKVSDQYITTADMGGPFQFALILLAFLTPVLTMGTIAEERRLGTLEGLLTAPVTHTALVLGKFLGVLAFYVILLVPTAVHVFFVFHLSSVGPDVWVLASNYLGLLLLGCFMLSLGILCSSLTRSQVVAAMAGIITLLLFLLVGAVLPGNPPSSLDPAQAAHIQVLTALYNAAKFVAYGEHFMGFLSGAIDLRDVVFFVSFSVFFLFVSVVAVANRKWR